MCARNLTCVLGNARADGVDRGRAMRGRGAAVLTFVCFEHNNEADLSGVPSIDNPVYV